MKPPTRPEFDLIARIRQRASHGRGDVVLGIGDDAAVLAVPAGRQLVVAMDTLNAGVHFPGDTAPGDIGWKSLAVNLSDLAAMGAEPAWCTLSLSLPSADPAWVDAFLEGFLDLARLHDVALVGGDTTRGPLSVCVAAHGWVEPGTALRRDGARPGDLVWVTGTLGDAAGALAQWRDGGGVDARLRARLDRPVPRIAVGRALPPVASACIDVSDGLLADLGHVCAASGVGAEILLDALPCPEVLRECFDAAARRRLQATGGDDYELCFTTRGTLRDAVAAIAADTGVDIACIGRIVAGREVEAFDAEGRPWRPDRPGHEHFTTQE
ncbi:thiamine-phosphate kinase [Luteimonas vadosa]|uniref:Thiamine-monophosphate kinase n=1 Tax=Luteimonas vadosa TaxID=1165507 RepID=A0ABP9DPV7_9GAMM